MADQEWVFRRVAQPRRDPDEVEFVGVARGDGTIEGVAALAGAGWAPTLAVIADQLAAGRSRSAAYEAACSVLREWVREEHPELVGMLASAAMLHAEDGRWPCNA